MTGRVGVLRNEAGLIEALDDLASLPSDDAHPEVATWETTNLLTISTALTRAALLRTETRGSHWREDYPDRDDAKAGHVDVWLAADGTLQTEWRYSPSTDPSAAEVST